MAVKILPDGRQQFFDNQGNVLAGGKLFFYAAGSTTKQDTYTTSAGNVANSNPIILDSAGRTPYGVWLTQGLLYKEVLAPANDTDPPTSPIWTEDNISGVNDISATADEWVASALTTTFISGTSFSLPGDQTSVLTPGRRVKATVTAGTVYGTILTSVFGAVTTLALLMDGVTALDSGLSAVSYGFLNNSNPSFPNLIFRKSDGAPALNMVNGSLVGTVAGSALTIALKTKAGNDPSLGDPVYIIFRNVTAATGDFTVLTVTAATSFVVSSGSTLGSRNGIPFRVWIAAFNDASTLRLTAINCVTTSAGAGSGSDVTAIYPLSGFAIASSTAEGGAGAADSAQTFYTGSAVTSKAYSVLGYMTWESGLATAGTWSTGPTRIELFGASVPLPGQPIQVQHTNSAASASGTTTTPFDNTIPQITEGTQFMTQAITPTSAANVLDIQALGNHSCNTRVLVTGALHQDAVANALTAVPTLADTASFQISIRHRMLAATTSATTFRERAGGSGASTIYFNADSGGTQLYLLACGSHMNVTELMG